MALPVDGYEADQRGLRDAVGLDADSHAEQWLAELEPLERTPSLG